ncbi:hypothetical protein AS850_12910 [Frondihabitans sp. 762G35]|uniref:hypothetical protein n=1 Tax=Frondihabitans sp. 762G35 TaxID=1446794 RepID=UPI000D228FFA|nr:hypothetical protein [Frondihabitans sp. 762G35]ARC57978.1 hypothetical protein AS850_12910 [Frondihabitans sp. 762G35]
MPSQKNLEKNADKAYKKAKEAVEEARKAAKKVDRKARTKAKALGKELEKTSAKTKATTRKRPDALYTPPLPHAITTEVTSDSGSTTEVDLGELTTIQLRAIAKSRRLTGYTRLSKAALVERLRSGEPTR